MPFTHLNKPPTNTTITSNSFTNGTTVTVAGTYVPPTGVSYIKVKMAGGGGGGGGAGQSTLSGGAGGTGGTSTFGTSLLTAPGGGGGSGNAGTPSGGTGSSAPTVNSPAIAIVAVAGGPGSGGFYNNVSQNLTFCGGIGGSNPFGSFGTSTPDNTGLSPIANTGGGGAGGGSGASGAALGQTAAGGGGAGAYIEAIITSPLSSYSYSVGAGGTAGTPQTSQPPGQTGATGVIIIEEYYA